MFLKKLYKSVDNAMKRQLLSELPFHCIIYILIKLSEEHTAVPVHDGCKWIR